MDPRRDWPAEGRLIEDARERLKISQNEAASRVPMSGTRWRQIIKGEAGEMTSVRGVRTLVAMAQVVGVTPRQFEEAGRRDAAEELREIGRQPEPGRKLSPHEQELRLIREIRERVEALERLRDQRGPGVASDHDEDTA